MEKLKSSNAKGERSKATQANMKTSYENARQVECNPRSSNPDVGIFSCDVDNHCIQDDDSGLGGFCVAYQEAVSAMRRLQDGGLCDDIYLDCDCSSFVNGTGTYTCVANECVDDEETICGEKEDVVVVNMDGSYRTSTCFVDTDGSPIESYCYSTMFDGTTKTGCELEYNGEMCAGCSHVVCSDEFGGGEGLEFDCSNVSSDPMAKGSTCDGGEWRDFFLNPSEPSAPTMAEPTPAVAPTPAVEPTPAADEPTMETIESNPTLEEPPAPDTPTSSPPPIEIPTSGGYRLATRASIMLTIFVGSAALLSASVSVVFT